MSKIFKNKIFIAAICFLLAALIAFVIIPKQKKSDDVIEVVRTNYNIPSNTYITEDMIKTVSVTRESVSENAIQDKAEVVGKYSTVMIYSDDNIIGEKLSTEPSDSGLYALNDGEYAVSVTIDNLAKGFSGKLLAGDVVSVYGYNEETKAMENTSDLKYVKVLAVSNAKGIDLTQERGMGGETSEDVIPATVTLKVNEYQAAELVRICNTGNVHIVFAGRGAKGDELLNR